MAGASSSFDADEFRQNIRDTMLMGLTGTAADRPKFIFNATETYTVGEELDDSGTPYDLTVAPTVAGTPAKQVLCAVEWVSGKNTSTDGSTLGDFEEGDLILTLLDVDYTQIKGADHVELDGTRYEIRYVQPSVGLFDVTVYQLHCTTYNQK